MTKIARTGALRAKHGKRVTAILCGLGMATLMVSPAPAAQTITPASVDQFQHFVDCFAALFNDPEAHALYCTPSRAAPVGGSNGGSYGPGGQGGNEERDCDWLRENDYEAWLYQCE